MKCHFSSLRRAALGLGVAACAIAIPASARDHQGYVGIEAGMVIPQDLHFDVSSVKDGITINHKNSWTVDGVAGYDWGLIRTEVELAHSQTKPKSIEVAAIGVPNPAGPGLVSGTFADAHGKLNITTAMANALLDFGGNGNVGIYAGVGAGRAWVKDHYAIAASAPRYLDDSDSAWAWQAIAGVRFPISDSLELGLKYKYLNTHQLREVDELGRTERFGLRTHSFLASVLFNFGGAAAPPPPPPPPPPPQTKTCPDGSTVDINAECPVPPPPVVAPQGERG